MSFYQDLVEVVFVFIVLGRLLFTVVAFFVAFFATVVLKVGLLVYIISSLKR